MSVHGDADCHQDRMLQRTITEIHRNSPQAVGTQRAAQMNAR